MEKLPNQIIRRLQESREMIDKLLEMEATGGDVAHAFWLAIDQELVYRVNYDLYDQLHQALREVELAGGNIHNYL